MQINDQLNVYDLAQLIAHIIIPTEGKWANMKYAQQQYV